MIRINEIKIDVRKNQKEILRREIFATLKLQDKDVVDYKIFKQSIDARKKERIYFTYAVDVEVAVNEVELVERLNKKNVMISNQKEYEYPNKGAKAMNHPPIVVGAGPAGLFSALLLAELGYNPILVERGKDVDQRSEDVDNFWQGEPLNPESNVQFGEGGAGAFSDGKLTTLIKNIRCRKVLQELVRHGAPEEIMYSYRPHVGTDVLKEVVKNIRLQIIALGGQVRFETKLTKLILENNQVQGIEVNHNEVIHTNDVILAVGHSARDTFEALYGQGVHFTAKSFAIGVRVEHPQDMIDQSQYGEFAELPELAAADYKLSHQTSNGRGAYTFCMCPGGVVVAAASEEGGVVTNGMSYHARDKENANSALLVGVTPNDYGSDHPLAGIEFQRKWERLAYQLAGEMYDAPCQLVGDFLKDQPSKKLGKILPSYEPNIDFVELKDCLPGYVIESLREAIPVFGRKIKGFDREDAVLTGVETRSSSPVRIDRDDACQSITITGLYPCGEGAGYAGGIISAAVDGLRVAEQIATQYQSIKK